MNERTRRGYVNNAFIILCEQVAAVSEKRREKKLEVARLRARLADLFFSLSVPKQEERDQ